VVSMSLFVSGAVNSKPGLKHENSNQQKQNRPSFGGPVITKARHEPWPAGISFFFILLLSCVLQVSLGLKSFPNQDSYPFAFSW
jgi:hypothetical protein